VYSNRRNVTEDYTLATASWPDFLVEATLLDMECLSLCFLIFIPLVTHDFKHIFMYLSFIFVGDVSIQCLNRPRMSLDIFVGLCAFYC
jgi:hypothetical protein